MYQANTIAQCARQEQLVLAYLWIDVEVEGHLRRPCVARHDAAALLQHQVVHVGAGNVGHQRNACDATSPQTTQA
jgi:hypothetical protein